MGIAYFKSFKNSVDTKNKYYYFSFTDHVTGNKIDDTGIV